MTGSRAPKSAEVVFLRHCNELRKLGAAITAESVVRFDGYDLGIEGERILL